MKYVMENIEKINSYDGVVEKYHVSYNLPDKGKGHDI